MTKLTDGTPIEELEESGTIYTSQFYVEHLADLIRLAILYKYGGIYLDTDFIVLKSFDSIAPTFFATEVVDLVTNCAIGFSQKGFGHNLLDAMLR